VLMTCNGAVSSLFLLTYKEQGTTVQPEVSKSALPGLSQCQGEMGAAGF